ncbi:MAG TPA: GDSL-type esterase/lipase family protein [Ferrovibrio sp.]|uniref:GDSL-type esterase/lipase family protein n=1 Tax=Ferrovibrio sp. TaxID=1917215 RepID=UPI002ED1B95A
MPQPQTATISFADAPGSITADLGTGVATQAVRILPLGDSHTHGVMGYSNKESGGYRILLADKLDAAGLKYDFVGSLRNGPARFDNQHEGHSGWQTDQLTAIVPEVLAATKPDVVLLMSGSNDARFNTLSTMKADTVKLVGTISQHAPDAQILLATSPPARPDNTVNMSPAKLAGYNRWLPGLVAGEKAKGVKIDLVDNGNITLDDIGTLVVDWGVHLTGQGYEKLATNWFNALTSLGIEQQTIAANRKSLAGARNLIGSPNADILRGDEHANILKGGAGNDVIHGNGGDDVIDGGPGDDILSGGPGADTFVFVKGQGGADVILDFDRTSGDRVQTNYSLSEIQGWGTPTLILKAEVGIPEALHSDHIWAPMDLIGM